MPVSSRNMTCIILLEDKFPKKEVVKNKTYYLVQIRTRRQLTCGRTSVRTQVQKKKDEINFQTKR